MATIRKILTIGIPSYNRLEELTRLVSQIYTSELLAYINVLIVDDGQEKKIKKHFLNNFSEFAHDIQIHENPGNLGYAATFLRILQECKTEYLLMMADDDFINPESIKYLISDIENINPDFISPQFFINSKLERGVNESREIAIHEYRSCCNHAPGLVYKISSCKPYLDNLLDRLKQGKTDVIMYPQVTVVIHLLHAKKKCIWLNYPTAYEGSNLPSGLKDSDGSNYWEFIPRCRQLVDFEDLLISLDENDESKNMLKIHRSAAYNQILGSLIITSPELGAAFYKSACSMIFRDILRKIKILRAFKRYLKAK